MQPGIISGTCRHKQLKVRKFHTTKMPNPRPCIPFGFQQRERRMATICQADEYIDTFKGILSLNARSFVNLGEKDMNNKSTMSTHYRARNFPLIVFIIN